MKGLHVNDSDDGFDYEAFDRQALEEWHAERRGHAQKQWRAKIPAAQARPGGLDPRVLVWVDQLAAGTAGNLVLLGPVGTGKTWHAWHGIDAAYTRGWHGIARFYSAYQWKRHTTPRLDTEEMHRAATADALILDDPGALRVGEWDKEHLLGVIDERWNEGLPTVVTSNSASLAEMLGPRAASRMADGATVITLDGPDRRTTR